MHAARLSDDEASFLLSLYRRLFPREGKEWPTLAATWDFARSRPWSCLATDFHATSVGQLRALDEARRAWSADGDPERDGRALAALSSAGQCGFSLGLSPWTDSTLHDTVTPTTKSLVAIVGHDWPSIAPAKGPVEARAPLELLPLLDATAARGLSHARGLPPSEAFRRAGVGLIYLNLVPDFRPPLAPADGPHPFPDASATFPFGYPACAAGLQAALESAHALHPLRGVVTWGRRPWEALRGLTEAPGPGLDLLEACRAGGRQGFVWGKGRHPVRIHPFPSPAPRHLLWTPALEEAYGALWQALLARH